MKKTLLASAITLTYLGFATSSALAEENQAQTTSAETTQQTTTANKVETKEPVPSTEASSSIPTTSTTNPSKTSAKKEESQVPEDKKMVGYLKKISGASMKLTRLPSIGKKFTGNGTTLIRMVSCSAIRSMMGTF